MKQDKHISTSDWLAYFSSRDYTPERKSLKQEILAHILVCTQCREFYERSTALQQAAMELAALRPDGAADSAAYLAVASSENIGPRRETEGNLCVCIDCQPDETVFITDTLEQNGCAMKYAMNPECDDRRLADDGDALDLVLRDGSLTVSLSEPIGSVSWQLFTDNPEDDRSGQLEGNGNPIDIALPRNGLCTFELRFGK